MSSAKFTAAQQSRFTVPSLHQQERTISPSH